MEKLYILQISDDKKNWQIYAVYRTYELASEDLRKLDGYRRILEKQVNE